MTQSKQSILAMVKMTIKSVINLLEALSKQIEQEVQNDK